MPEPDGPASTGDTSRHERYARPIPTDRIARVTRHAREPSALASYARLQSGRWWAWTIIWILQMIRHSPVYLLPLMTGYLIDRIDPAAPDRVMAVLPGVLIATSLLCAANVASCTIARIMLSRINRILVAGLRHSLMRRLNRLTFAFHDRAQAGVLQNTFLLDMQRLDAFQQFIAEGLFVHGSSVLIMLVIAGGKNPLILLVIAAAVPINLAVARLLWRPISRTNEEFRIAESEFVDHLGEALAGIRTTRAHAVEEASESRVSRAAGRVAAKGMRLDFFHNLFGSTSWSVSTFLYMVVVALGVWLATGGERPVSALGIQATLQPLSIGDLTVLLSYYGIIAGAMGAILGSMPAAAAASDAIRSLSRLYREEDEEPNRGRRELPTLTGTVELEQVRFTYPGASAHCLDEVSLHIPAGGSLALVGPSGSGKSTIAGLILGFYDPQRGTVRIDGHDLKDCDRRSLRRQVGVVGQDVVLFRDSILGNIAWGDPVPDLERARDAARRAHALEFIEQLPDGFAHVLADRGGGLSGGQRQRLAIARALYRDPRLLILDEATSALDAASERLVQEALAELMRGRSTLIIAHRLATVRRAGHILVLEAGRVMESGTYDELMAHDGRFRRLMQETRM